MFFLANAHLGIDESIIYTCDLVPYLFFALTSALTHVKSWYIVIVDSDWWFVTLL